VNTKQLLVKVNDISRLHELNDIGNVTFQSKYSSIICFDCDEQRVDELTFHPIVDHWSESPVGTLDV
jgi:uncharacterized protein YlbG (UPF0298 family)